MVIIGIREEGKARTREIILSKTQSLLELNGFIKVSSKEIAHECGVSQGTIFLHFNTKYNLLNTILESNIESLEIELKRVCNTKDIPDIFFKNLMDTLISFENLLSRAYKDYPYLNENLKKQLDGFETVFKNLLFDNLRNSSKQKINIVDSFIIVDAFVSQIKVYLFDKDSRNLSISVLKQRRGRISKLFNMLFR